ncbi:hypothetical protein BGU98_15075, partial [Clostridioides difficile]
LYSIGQCYIQLFIYAIKRKIMITYIDVSSKNTFIYRYNYFGKTLILQNKKVIIEFINILKN